GPLGRTGARNLCEDANTANECGEYRLAGMGRLTRHAYDAWSNTVRRPNMLYWALMFFVVALIAGILGFTGVAMAAAGVAKLLFVVFLILFVLSLVAHLVGGGSRRSLN